MKLFYADISSYLRGAAQQRRRQSSILVRALLSCTFQREYSVSLPNVAKQRDGKPFFPSRPDIHFSLSHGANYVLCVLSDTPVGCDIEQIRPVDRRVIERVMSPAEIEAYEKRGSKIEDFFALWTLKESLLKAGGDSSLSFRDLEFELDPVRCTNRSVCCAVYDTVPGFSLAVCALGGEMPEKAEEIDGSELRAFFTKN